MLPMCALAGARLARAYAKASVASGIWSSDHSEALEVDMVLGGTVLAETLCAPPCTSVYCGEILGCWMAGAWNQRHCLAEVVKAFILERECGIRRNLTCLLGARTGWIGLVQNDFKKIITYSTCSQF